MDLFSKYGLGDLMKYITPTTNSNNINGILSLADRVLQRSKQGDLNIDKIIEDKK